MGSVVAVTAVCALAISVADARAQAPGETPPAPPASPAPPGPPAPPAVFVQPAVLPAPVEPDPAAGKSPFELEYQYQWQDTGRGFEISALLQPDLFLHRRLMVGARLASAAGSTVFAGFVGYQHFYNRTLVPYGRAVYGGYAARVGQEPFARTESRSFYGGELGVKVYLGSWFYLTSSIGASNLNLATIGLGFGVDPGTVLAPLALLHGAR